MVQEAHATQGNKVERSGLPTPGTGREEWIASEDSGADVGASSPALVRQAKIDGSSGGFAAATDGGGLGGGRRGPFRRSSAGFARATDGGGFGRGASPPPRS